MALAGVVSVVASEGAEKVRLWGGGLGGVAAVGSDSRLSIGGAGGETDCFVLPRICRIEKSPPKSFFPRKENSLRDCSVSSSAVTEASLFFSLLPDSAVLPDAPISKES